MAATSTASHALKDSTPYAISHRGFRYSQYVQRNGVPMTIRRAVPATFSVSFDRSRRFYSDVLGFDVGMDLGWVMPFVSPSNPTAQITVVHEEATASTIPAMTVEVDDVDDVYERAEAAGYAIVHPLTDEPWGVRRFFVQDPDGTVVNVMSHISPARS